MYNRFAEIYDRLVEDIDYEGYYSNIKKICSMRNLKINSILELGCGTGNLTKYLATENTPVVALDISSEMLNIAYPKLINFPNVQLIHGDMVNFRSQEQYDLIVASLDCFNYFVEPEDLDKCFENISTLLAPNGLLVFDINSFDRFFHAFGNETYVYETQGIFYTWENNLDTVEEIVDMHLNFFVSGENNRYWHIAETQSQKYYSVDYMKKTLKQYGLTGIQCYDVDNMKNISEDTQRILFVAENNLKTTIR